MADAVAQRRREREELLELARSYVGALSERLDVVAAAVAGSVARGDFNVWSDVDVVVVARELPERVIDRATVLMGCAPARVQPVGFTPGELESEWRKGNRLVREAAERGIVVRGDDVFGALRSSSPGG